MLILVFIIKVQMKSNATDGGTIISGMLPIWFWTIRRLIKIGMTDPVNFKEQYSLRIRNKSISIKFDGCLLETELYLNHFIYKHSVSWYERGIISWYGGMPSITLPQSISLHNRLNFDSYYCTFGWNDTMPRTWDWGIFVILDGFRGLNQYTYERHHRTICLVSRMDEKKIVDRKYGTSRSRACYLLQPWHRMF